MFLVLKIKRLKICVFYTFSYEIYHPPSIFLLIYNRRSRLKSKSTLVYCSRSSTLLSSSFIVLSFSLIEAFNCCPSSVNSSRPICCFFRILFLYIVLCAMQVFCVPDVQGTSSTLISIYHTCFFYFLFFFCMIFQCITSHAVLPAHTRKSKSKYISFDLQSFPIISLFIISHQTQKKWCWSDIMKINVLTFFTSGATLRGEPAWIISYVPCITRQKLLKKAESFFFFFSLAEGPIFYSGSNCTDKIKSITKQGNGFNFSK